MPFPAESSYELRLASDADRDELQILIARSARVLCAEDYRPEQIEGALRDVFGVDSQLIADGTYIVAVEAGRLLGGGGWGRRATLFGADANPGRDARELDPRTEAAKIRAFFVDPDQARRGIGGAILQSCEDAARAAGFHRMELMATLAGARLYSRFGFVADDPVEHPLAPGLTIEFVPMSKELGTAFQFRDF